MMVRRWGSSASGIYIYISAVTPLSEKILPPGTLVAGNKDGFSHRYSPLSLFLQIPSLFFAFLPLFLFDFMFSRDVAKSQNLHSKGTRTARLGRPIVFRNFHLDNS